MLSCGWPDPKNTKKKPMIKRRTFFNRLGLPAIGALALDVKHLQAGTRVIRLPCKENDPPEMGAYSKIDYQRTAFLLELNKPCLFCEPFFAYAQNIYKKVTGWRTVIKYEYGIQFTDKPPGIFWHRPAKTIGWTYFPPETLPVWGVRYLLTPTRITLQHEDQITVQDMESEGIIFPDSPYKDLGIRTIYNAYYRKNISPHAKNKLSWKIEFTAEEIQAGYDTAALARGSNSFEGEESSPHSSDSQPALS